MKGRILLVEDDDSFRLFLRTVLEDEGYEVETAENGSKGLTLLRREIFDLVISDLKMPGKSGLELFRTVKMEQAPPRFIFLTAFGTVDEAVAAMKEGAVDFLTKPLERPEVLCELVARVLEGQASIREYTSLKEMESAGIPPIELVFAGQAMQPICKLVVDVAGTPANVMICGESGTGKELVARSIHQLSSRKQAAFITLNCAAIPENLLESELFGHEKGAFTGAVQARQGKFELANHGTIFLDEIGEMPIGLQAKLLRILQERVFERVGGNREIKVDVRIVAATNRDLQVEVTQRRFREDLFYRLNVFPLQLPPLRNRIETLPQLIDFFVRKYSRSMGKPVTGIDAEALSAMKGYAWPGNIRELQNVIERALIVSQGNIGLGSLPESIRNSLVTRPNESKAIIKSMEKEMIVAALRKHSDNRRLTAAELGISRRALQYKLKDFELLDA